MNYTLSEIKGGLFLIAVGVGLMCSWGWALIGYGTVYIALVLLEKKTK